MSRRLLLSALALLLLAAPSAAADNATKLRFASEKVMEGSEPEAGEQRTVAYQPKRKGAYWLILFPDAPTTQADLEAAGVPAQVAGKVFRDLAYVDVGSARQIVVAQEDRRLAFTDPTFAVPELRLAYRKDACELVLEYDGEGWRAVAIR